MKRLNMAIIILGMLLCFSGCASLFEREYYVRDVYVDDSQIDDTGEEIEVKSYVGLVNAISKLVAAHQESATIIFNNYDGDVSADMFRACEEVRANTAIGAYSVDYMSYLPPRLIVSYYETDVNITYKKTADEVLGIVNLSGSQSVREALQNALDDFSDYLVIKVTTSSMDADTIEGIIMEYYYSNPGKAVAKPSPVVNMYPDSGLEKVFEVSISYGDEYDVEVLMERRSELMDAIANKSALVEPGSTAEMAFDIFEAVYGKCQPITNAGDEISNSTSYSAAVEGKSDSEGMAMLFKALCDSFEIECQIVQGKINIDSNSMPHSWNIIAIDDQYYHIDTSMARERGAAESFLRNDSNMWGRYWWDPEMYPPCEGHLNYYNVVEVTPPEES